MTKKHALCLAFIMSFNSSCTIKPPNEPVEPLSQNDLYQIIDDAPTQDSSVVITDEVIPQYREIIAPVDPVDVLTTEALPLNILLESIAADNEWSVHFTPSADADTLVLVNFRNIGFKDAIAKIAATGEHIAIFEDKFRRVVITRRATFTFRFPASLANVIQWQFNFGGNPASNLSGGDDAGQNTLDATSNLSSGDDNDAVIAFLTSAISGGGGDSGTGGGDTIVDDVIENVNTVLDTNNAPPVVSAQPQLGIVIVTGNARQLRRAESVINRLLQEATTRVDVKIAIVEANINDETAIGIDWDKIIHLNNGANINDLGIEINKGSRPLEIVNNNNDTFRIGVKGGGDSLTALLSLLRTQSNLRIVTRPNLVINNHTVADIVDASTTPYIESINTDIETDDNNNSTTVIETTAASIVEGLKLSLLPHVIDDKQIQLRLLPFVGAAPEFVTFEFGAQNVITLPSQTTKQAVLDVTMSSGETLILAGNRITQTNNNTRGLPWVETPLTDNKSNSQVQREVAIIINVSILPPPDIEPIVEKIL